ncbi:MAG: hypothetical protein QXQ37_00735 [Nitrososphaerota archaeon]
MSHSPMCLWKKKRLSEKLRRQVSIEDVHFICNYFGFTSSEEAINWIENTPPDEIERILQKRKKRKNRETEYEYAYSYVY